MIKQYQFITFIGLLICAANVSAQVQFPVTFNATASGLSAAEQAQITMHVQAAGSAWVRTMDISGARSIEVEIGINDVNPTANGGSVTSAFVVNNGRDMFEQGAAAEVKTGTDPNGSTADVRFTFNTSYLRNELWFDPNPNQRVDPVPTNRTDAMSVFLHEFGHAFAYNGFNDLTTGIPQPTFWSTFDRWIVPRPSAAARNLFSGANATASFGSNPDLTTGNLFHWANSTLLQNKVMRGSEPYSIDAEHMRQITSSESINALVDELMNGVVFVRGTRYQISALDRATLLDVGIPTKLFANGFE